MGAFLALFTGFVGKDESTPPSGSAERQPANQPDHKKDKSLTKDPVTIAATIAPAPAPNVLDLPRVLVEPSVSRNLPIDSPVELQAAPVADHSSSIQITSSSYQDQPATLQPQMAFALRLTPATQTTPPVPSIPELPFSSEPQIAFAPRLTPAAQTPAPVPSIPELPFPHGPQIAFAPRLDPATQTPPPVPSIPESPFPPGPQMAFAPRLVPATQALPVVLSMAQNASSPVELKLRAEVGIELSLSMRRQSEPAPPVQHETSANSLPHSVAAAASPAPSESQTSNQPEPVPAANDPKDNRVAAQQPSMEAAPIARSEPLANDTVRTGPDAQSVRSSVLSGIPDTPAADREVKPADPVQTMPSPLPNDQHQSPAPPASQVSTTSHVSSTDAQPEQTGARSPTNPVSERAVPPRVQQQSTQQQAGNGQPGSRDSKAQTGDRRDESPDRNQSRIQKNPVAFEPHAQTGWETKATTIDASRPAVNSRAATIIAPEIETKATIQPQPARQISLKLAGPDSKQVDVQLMERAGRVQVSVRTADRQLAKSLQGDLGDLVGRLENKGYKTEAWAPASRHATGAVFEPGNTANGQGQPEHSGSRSGQQQQEHQGRNGSNQRQQPRWAAQLEETLSVEEAGKKNE